MSTAFVGSVVPLGGGEELFIDGNSKITAENGSAANPVPNAFSLPHMSTCPGATSECLSICYVSGLKQLSSETYGGFVRNERTIHSILMSPVRAASASETLARWIRERVSSFRWHTSGDIFSARYALWINAVCEQAPGVKFWIYTRSFQALDALTAHNLVVNLSADADNFDAALTAQERYGHRICYLTTNGEIPVELRADSVVFPTYKLRGRDLDDPTTSPWWRGLSDGERRMVCPADYFGQSESHRCGPCKKCLR